uniref:TRAF-type domain-containing protein n=1 Tax=Lotharella globosa TaxID=91324 RepID=A0A7S3YV92_9EUKA
MPSGREGTHLPPPAPVRGLSMEVKLKPCTYRSFGCPVKLSEDLLNKHLEEDVETHLNLVTKALNLEKSQKEFQKEVIQVATRRCREADGENMQLRKQLQALELFEQLVTGSINESKLSKKFSTDDEKSESREDNIAASSRKLQTLLQEHKDISDEVKKLKEELAQTTDDTEVREVPEVPFQGGTMNPLHMAVSGLFGTAIRTRPSMTPGEKLMLSLKPLDLDKDAVKRVSSPKSFAKF